MRRSIRPLPFILASASPRRRRILAEFPFPVAVRPSRVPEPPAAPGTPPRRYAEALAERKAREVADRVTDGMILGADTVVYRKGRIYGKPADAEEAKRMLTELAGRRHWVYTALVLAVRDSRSSPQGRLWRGVWSTAVTMKSLTPERIARLAHTNHDKAGAYAAQAPRNPFIARTRGDFDTVVGLPRRGLRSLLARARRAGYAPAR